MPPSVIAVLAQLPDTFWMPPSASSYSGDVDRVFYLILWICALMFALVAALMTIFVVRYRRREGKAPPPAPSFGTALEITWTVIPTLVVIVIFYFGFRTFLDMATPPPNAYDIQVTAFKWGWAFGYPNGHVDNRLHVPLDRPVRLVLRSEDVIHSLYVPAFRVKKDVVPGRYNTIWFQATKAGEFDLFCTEYCGTKHSDMATVVVVQEPREFERWLDDAGNWAEKLPPAEAGRKLWEIRGCKQCHTLDGSSRIGPSFLAIWGKERPLSDGSTVLVDENYVRESILDPSTRIAAGYENVMPTYRGRLKDSEITALIEFIKSLAPAPAEAGTPTGGGEDGQR